MNKKQSRTIGTCALAAALAAGLAIAPMETAQAASAKTQSKAAKSKVTAAMNQVGFLPEEEKSLFLTGDAAASYEIINTKSGKTVLEGDFPAARSDKATGSDVAEADISKLTKAGEYQAVITTEEGDTWTRTFTIGENVYDDLYASTVRMLYLQRCGTATDEEYAGDFAHEACHMDKAVVYGTKETKDVSGGWHDAGDYGRYVVPGAKTIEDLFLAYEDYDLTADDLGIPESGNGVPDILDEAKWELDWMLKMQDAKSGGVYHKVTGQVFPGMKIRPEEETSEMILSPISTAATADFAAVMAKASVIYEEIDPSFAATALRASEKAYDYVKDSKDMAGFTNPSDISTGEYGDSDPSDEIYWAAVELALTGNKEAADAVCSRYSDAQQTGLGWAVITTYADYDLAKYAEDDDLMTAVAKKLAPIAQQAAERIRKGAENLTSATAEDAYYMSFGENYVWGSNMNVADNGMLLLMAENLEEDAVGSKDSDAAGNSAGNKVSYAAGDAGDGKSGGAASDEDSEASAGVSGSAASDEDSEAGDAYHKLADRQLAYLLGANGTGYCFVTGYGDKSPEDPHHRLSIAVGKAMPGMLVGGPDSALDDSCTKRKCKKSAPALCYVDSVQSYSTNEITIYWNSPLIYLLAGIMNN